MNRRRFIGALVGVAIAATLKTRDAPQTLTTVRGVLKPGVYVLDSTLTLYGGAYVANSRFIVRRGPVVLRAPTGPVTFKNCYFQTEA